MSAHGWQKVDGGMAHFQGFLVTLGIPGWMAYVSAYAEFLGGILLIVGLLTRFAAFAIFINMMVAVLKVTLKNGLMGPEGYEFGLTLAAMAFALIFFGGGSISLDHAVFGGGGKKGPPK